MNTKQFVKIILSVSAAVYFYTMVDIMIWQRIFETHKLWNLGIPAYHNGWVYMLAGLIVSGIALLSPDIRAQSAYLISLLILSKSGIEDILYYWLDRRPIPYELPWLSDSWFIIHPVTNYHLILSSAIWIAVVIIIDIILLRNKPWK